MAKFEYNWATAEMVKLYLRNSRAQAKRKARKAGGASTATAAAEIPVNSGPTGAATDFRVDAGVATDLDEDSDSDDSDED